MNKIKVLHISGATELGGNEVHILTLFKYLNKDKFECALALPGKGLFFEQAASTDHLKIYKLEGDLLANKKSVNLLRKGIDDYKPDIVHTHNRREDYSGGKAAKLENVKAIISTIHDRINMNQQGRRVNNLKARYYKKILSSSFDYLIAVSEVTRQDLLKQLRIDPAKVVHITNGTDLENFHLDIDKKKKRESLGFSSSDRLIGLVARIRGRQKNKKGHYLLIEAFTRIKEVIPKAKMVIIGNDQSAEKYLQELAEMAGVSDRLYCLGYRKDIYEVVSVLDVEVLPSLFEGLPRALMEAMGLGIPVIGTAVDGIKELLNDGRYGIQVAPENPNEIAEAVITLLQDSFLYKTMSKEGKKRIHQDYSAEKMAVQTEQLYELALSNKNND